MSWRVVAERDALDPYRSRSLFVIAGLYAGLFGLLAYATGSPSQSAAGVFTSIAGFLVPLTALSVAYHAVAQPRENGALRVVLAYPHTRSEVVVGKAVGRSLLMVGYVTVGTLGAALGGVLGGHAPSLGSLALAWAATALFGAAMSCLAVGLSACLRTTNAAAMSAFGAFVVFTAWAQIPAGVRYLLNGFKAPGPKPEWARAFEHVGPFDAFDTVTNAALSNAPLTADAVYASAPFAVAVLLAWTLAPVAVGAWRFRQRDL